MTLTPKYQYFTVIFEYKLRLEKSLQKEKTEHKQTKEDCQSQAKILQDNKEQEQVEASKKYTALLQSYNLLQVSIKVGRPILLFVSEFQTGAFGFTVTQNYEILFITIRYLKHIK